MAARAIQGATVNAKAPTRIPIRPKAALLCKLGLPLRRHSLNTQGAAPFLEA